MVIVEAAQNPIIINEGLIYKNYEPIIKTSEKINTLINKLLDEDIKVPNEKDQKELDNFIEKYGDDLRKFAKALPDDKSKINDDSMNIVLNILDYFVNNILIGLILLIPVARWIAELVLAVLNLINLINFIRNFVLLSKNKENVRKAEDALYSINSQLKKINVNSIKDKRVKEKIINSKMLSQLIYAA